MARVCRTLADIVVLLLAAVNAQQLLANSRCNHYPERGTCEREFSVKWYYDRYDHRCRRFFYGGCDGNENRFDSLEECSSQCSYQEPTNRDRCFQPHDPGHCSSDIERWYFDQDKKQCVCSWWSGCGGNSNIYYSYNHCMLICGDYAEHGPGIDEKYWNRLNNHTMSIESQNVFNNPYPLPPNQTGWPIGPYSVQMPVDNNNNNYGHFLDHDQTKFVTINISHYDDGPQYLEAPPVATVPLIRKVTRPYKSNGVTIHRYDSEPRLLKEMDSSSNWQIQEQPSPNMMKRRFKVQKKKTPPRMIHVNPNSNYNNQENAYKFKLENSFSPIQTPSEAYKYQVVRTSPVENVQNHQKIAEALQNEAEETQRRMQESLRRSYYEQQWKKQQQMHAAQMNRLNPNPPMVNNQVQEDPSAQMVNQFKSHLEEHEKSLRQKLEAQFPDHVITLIPQIETIRRPDGTNVVRQRIQWTAHPKSYQQPSQYQQQQQYYQNNIPTEAPEVPQIETTTETLEFTTLAPVTIPELTTTSTTTPEPMESTISPAEMARINHEQMKKKHLEEAERRRLEHLKKLQEHQENQKRERERILKEREEMEKERQERRKAEEDRRKAAMATAAPVVETTIRPIPQNVYPTVPVRNNIVYDANVQAPQPTTKANAEPLDHYRPIIDHVTAAPLSLDDIIAMGDEKSEYEDEYDVPMDFPDTEAPPMTTTVAPRRAPPPPPPVYQRHTPSPPTQKPSGLMPIVSPPNSGVAKKSKLFSAISSEEYTQDIDFDPYVDFVM